MPSYDNDPMEINFNLDYKNWTKFMESGLCQTIKDYLKALEEGRQEDADKILRNEDKSRYSEENIRKTLIDKFYELSEISADYEPTEDALSAANVMDSIYRTLFIDEDKASQE
jgi:hypothetical protein